MRWEDEERVENLAGKSQCMSLTEGAGTKEQGAEI